MNFKTIIDEETNDKLITPNFGDWSGWTKENRWCRSLHINNNNQVVSVGFPKFLNLGESIGSEIGITTKELLKVKNPIATLKIDGSLIIRYVRDGTVKFRTRGSLDDNFECWQKDIEVFKNKYPLLFDPGILPNQSVLLEYVSPDNQIVIKYDEPEIFMIGCVSYDKNKSWENANFKLHTMESIKFMADEMRIPCTLFFNIQNEEELDNLLEKIKHYKDTEGYVIRFDNEQQLVKCKSLRYIKLHALKSNLDTQHMVEVWLDSNRKTFKEFKEYFETLYDFETFQYCLPIISAMFDGINETYKQIEHVKKFVELNKHNPRKEFALLAQKRFNSYNLSMCFMFLDNKNIDDRTLKKLVLQKSKHISKRIFDPDFIEKI